MLFKDASDDYLTGYAEALSTVYDRATQVADKQCILVELEHHMASVRSERHSRTVRRDRVRADVAKFKRESLEFRLSMLKTDLSMARLNEQQAATLYSLGGPATGMNRAVKVRCDVERQILDCKAELAALGAEAKPLAPAAVTMFDMVNLCARLEARIAGLEARERTMPCGCSKDDGTCLAGSMEACAARQRACR